MVYRLLATTSPWSPTMNAADKRYEDLNDIVEMYKLYQKNGSSGPATPGGHGEMLGPNFNHFLHILSTSRHGNDSDLLSILNQSLEEYDYPSLEAVDPPLQIFLIVMYSLTAVLSLTGNTTAIIVLTFGRRWVISSVLILVIKIIHFFMGRCLTYAKMARLNP